MAGKVQLHPEEVNDSLKLGHTSREYVIDGLLAVHSNLLVVGDEGCGKTLFVEQMCREVLRQEKVGGLFSPGAKAPRSILMLDTEMTKTEHRVRSQIFNDRGLKTPHGTLFKDTVYDELELDQPQSNGRVAVEEALGDYNVDVLCLDSGSDLVNDPSDSGSVQRLFSWLQSLYERQLLLASVIIHHHRKRQGNDKSPRSFDSVYGARQWKGKTDVCLNLSLHNAVVFKDRPGKLRKDFPEAVNDYMQVWFDVTWGPEECPPFAFAPKTQDTRRGTDTEADLLQEVLEMVRCQPGVYTATSIVPAIGRQRTATLKAVRTAIEVGLIERDEGKKLRATNSQVPDAGTSSVVA